jgi:hypothetical protein
MREYLSSDVIVRAEAINDMINSGFININTPQDHFRLMMLSQEEIDELVAEMMKGEKDNQMDFFWNGQTPNTPPKNQSEEAKKEEKQKQCDHEFVPYYGLKETFEYCKKCDQKR